MRRLKTESLPGCQLHTLPKSKSKKGSQDHNYTQNTASCNSRFAAVYQNLLVSAPSAGLKVKVQQTGHSKAVISNEQLIWTKSKARPVAAECKTDQNPESPVDLIICGNPLLAGNKPIQFAASTENKPKKTWGQEFSAAASKGLNHTQLISSTIMRRTADHIQIVTPIEQKMIQEVKAGGTSSQVQAANRLTVVKDGAKQQLVTPVEQKVVQGETRVTSSQVQAANRPTVAKDGVKQQLVTPVEQKVVQGETRVSSSQVQAANRPTVVKDGVKQQLVTPVEQKVVQGETRVTESQVQAANRPTVVKDGVNQQLVTSVEQKVVQGGKAGVTSSQVHAVPQSIVGQAVLKYQLAMPVRQKVDQGGEVTKNPTQSVSKGIMIKVDDQSEYLESEGKQISITATAAGASTGMEPNVMDFKQLGSLGKTRLEGLQQFDMAAEKAFISNSQMDLIVNHMIAQIKGGTSSMEIHLQPEYLGKIKMLVQSKESQISIQILAQTSETLNLLNANCHSIREALEQQGIKLSDVSINLAQQEMQDSRSGHGYREENQVGNSYVEAEDIYDNKEGKEQDYSYSYNLLNILA